ncbi:MAG: PQQ-binding-like beta-propeller repeat protein [Prolixibacteraceae bacterium]|jgi:outer membrane protein assembly factor BamB|nr:PQQ-binding-like beta-propeller repeat protein [Prolixibacteraceae bacterium]MBT6766129.1 PQQ-binding-like beta-propeller repeat protein [Prolixibacteraceae bacterium]MBT7000251.1 PQQ-binding-like beta-propeller repeat protein [Prolixibacteraceae bacterium]MBT7394232.1 PQQ-binding-like beta-propeller repeat protein [Prolixibacteraceae bacterium]
MKIIPILIVNLLLFLGCTKKTELYQWRGEDRKGIFQENNLLKVWSENGPEEIWFVEGIGNGYGSPTITDNEIFITGEIDSLAYLFCINFEGEVIWKAPYGSEWIKSFQGSRSAPTIVDDLIYVGSGMGNLYCLKRQNGEVVWSKDFVDDFQGQYPYHGHTEAPVVDNEKVFWTPGGKDHNVVALNRFTGKLLWSCKGHGEHSGYNQTNLIEIQTRKIFVTFSAYNLMGIDAETGELLWTHEQDNTPIEKRVIGIGDTHSNGIIFENGSIYYAAGDGNCGVKLTLSGDGTKIKEAWRNTNFDSFMGGIVKIDNYLYGCGTTKKELKSINATTGILSDSLKIGTGAVIAADNMLYYYNQRGQLSLLSFDNGKMKQVSSFKIARGSKEHFSHPVIKNGVLYQRHGNVLMAFDIQNKS